MKITKERAILCALTLVGVVALTLDRGTASPSQASGSAAIPPNPAELYSVPRAQLATLPAAPPTIAQQLRSARCAMSKPAGNAFLVPTAWAGVASRTAASVESPETRFLRSHRLEAILISELGGSAIINGKSVAVGQALDGFKLSSVAKTAVVMERGKARVSLKLEPLQVPIAGLSIQ